MSDQEPAAQNEIVMRGAWVKLLYLGDKNRAYSMAYSGKLYWFPTVGPVAIQVILGGLHGETSPLEKDGRIKIQTTEPEVGSKNTLGAYWDSNECYYWDDQANTDDRQVWVVTPEEEHPDRKIRYGDRVLFTNKSWAQQLLPKPDTKWLTTSESSGSLWLITKP